MTLNPLSLFFLGILIAVFTISIAVFMGKLRILKEKGKERFSIALLMSLFILLIGPSIMSIRPLLSIFLFLIFSFLVLVAALYISVLTSIYSKRAHKILGMIFSLTLLVLPYLIVANLISFIFPLSLNNLQGTLAPALILGISILIGLILIYKPSEYLKNPNF